MYGPHLYNALSIVIVINSPLHRNTHEVLLVLCLYTMCCTLFLQSQPNKISGGNVGGHCLGHMERLKLELSAYLRETPTLPVPKIKIYK